MQAVKHQLFSGHGCHTICDPCLEVLGEKFEIYIGRSHDGQPAHPCCRCGLLGKWQPFHPDWFKVEKTTRTRDWEECAGHVNDDINPKVDRKEVILPNPEQEGKR